jgi:hypothetical protein
MIIQFNLIQDSIFFKLKLEENIQIRIYGKL